MIRFWIALLSILVAPLAGAADLPTGPGRELLLRTCTGCHMPDSFASYHFTKDEYHAIVYRMADRGAQATGPELDQIADYLAKNFPKVDDPSKVNVNQATAKEIQIRLGLTPNEAKAIVSYRERHGDFHAVGDLYIIYGVDGAKIHAAKDKITF